MKEVDVKVEVPLEEEILEGDRDFTERRGGGV
jgi:hypothetical protein